MAMTTVMATVTVGDGDGDGDGDDYDDVMMIYIYICILPSRALGMSLAWCNAWLQRWWSREEQLRQQWQREERDKSHRYPYESELEQLAFAAVLDYQLDRLWAEAEVEADTEDRLLREALARHDEA